MKSIPLAALCCVLWAPSPGLAHPLYLFGDVAQAPVLVKLERSGSSLSGWYLYLRQAKDIRLEGKVDAGGTFALDEFDADTHRKTGEFTGNIKGPTWSGIWHKPDGTGVLTFRLSDNRDTLSGLNTKVSCQTRKLDRDFGYTYMHSLRLRVAHGVVKSLAISRRETSKYGDDQGCEIALNDLKQASSDAGILLASKADSGDSDMHCSVRILQNGDYLYVEMDDCKGAGDTMYCSPRSFWTNMVVDTKTQMCRSEE